MIFIYKVVVDAFYAEAGKTSLRSERNVYTGKGSTFIYTESIHIKYLLKKLFQNA